MLLIINSYADRDFSNNSCLCDSEPIQNTLFLVMIDDRQFIMLIGIECEIG